jgi:hypothetical protein
MTPFACATAVCHSYSPRADASKETRHLEDEDIPGKELEDRCIEEEKS